MIDLQFSTLQEFFWMNGHGPYVWGAYALGLAAVVFLVWSPLARRRRFVRLTRAAQRRQTTADAQQAGSHS